MCLPGRFSISSPTKGCGFLCVQQSNNSHSYSNARIRAFTIFAIPIVCTRREWQERRRGRRHCFWHASLARVVSSRRADAARIDISHPPPPQLPRARSQPHPTEMASCVDADCPKAGSRFPLARNVAAISHARTQTRLEQHTTMRKMMKMFGCAGSRPHFVPTHAVDGDKQRLRRVLSPFAMAICRLPPETP